MYGLESYMILKKIFFLYEIEWNGVPVYIHVFVDSVSLILAGEAKIIMKQNIRWKGKFIS